MAQPPIDWEAIERSPEFQELVHRRRSFVIPGTIFFLAWYLGFILLCAYAPDFMGESVYEGLTVGYVWALTQFLMVGGLGYAYLRRAQNVFDPLADKVAAHADALPPPSDEAAEAGLRAWCMSELRATSLWSLPVVMAELGKFDATAWIGDVTVPTGVLVTSHDKAVPTARQLQLAESIPGAITRYAPGGHTSLVFDLAHWKPVFLELVDEVVRRTELDTAA